MTLGGRDRPKAVPGQKLTTTEVVKIVSKLFSSTDTV
jgi:hypothetical protein